MNPETDLPQWIRRSRIVFECALVVAVVLFLAWESVWKPRRNSVRALALQGRADSLQVDQLLEAARASGADPSWLRHAPEPWRAQTEVLKLPPRILFLGSPVFSLVTADSVDLHVVPTAHPLLVLSTKCRLSSGLRNDAHAPIKPVSDTLDARDLQSVGELAIVVDVVRAEAAIMPSDESFDRSTLFEVASRVLAITGECVWLKRLSIPVSILLDQRITEHRDATARPR